MRFIVLFVTAVFVLFSYKATMAKETEYLRQRYFN